MKKIKKYSIVICSLIVSSMVLFGCDNTNTVVETTDINSTDIIIEENNSEVINVNDEEITSETGVEIVEYSGEAYCILNNNEYDESIIPITDEAYEYYSDLDELGRCGIAHACIDTSLMPTEDRGSIGSVKPSGWQTTKYDIVSGKYLYNRCHLIGYQLTAENANEKNLITGTRYLNIDGMLPFENMVADYIKETNNHVMYVVIPVFNENDLVAQGVQMMAYSVEDNGEGINFNVFCYNIQPGVVINYADGTSCLATDDTELENEETEVEENNPENLDLDDGQNFDTFVINTKTHKIHKTTCVHADVTSDNMEEYTGPIEKLENEGYEKCKVCFK